MLRLLYSINHSPHHAYTHSLARYLVGGGFNGDQYRGNESYFSPEVSA